MDVVYGSSLLFSMVVTCLGVFFAAVSAIRGML